MRSLVVNFVDKNNNKRPKQEGECISVIIRRLKNATKK